MNILAIDLGSYSVKFYECRLERKQLKYLGHREVIIAKIRSQFAPETTTNEIHNEIVKSYLKQSQFEGKIIYQIQEQFTSSRYLELPVNSRKKAEQMIPFQLEEDIPYSLKDIHFTSTLIKNGENFSALISIAQLDYFDNYYNYLESSGTLPAILTTEMGVIQSFIDQKAYSGSFCVVDIGHETTKAYFIHNREVISSHLTNLGGKVLDEIIAQTYQISIDEAIIYKHENCFFLTEDQLDDVTGEQREFAKLMQQAIMPLVLDLKRWELGYRVKFGNPIDNIYITGGSSNINNIENFLTSELNIKVQKFDPPKMDGLTEMEKPQFLLSYMMSAAQRSSTLMPNFLTGKYTSGFSDSISLHSLSFILSRALMLMVVLSALMMIDRVFFLNSKNDELDRRITKIIKADNLEISRRDQRKYRRDPESILKLMKRKNSMVKQEVKTIQSATEVNATNALVQLSEYISRNELVNMDFYENKNGSVRVKFSSKEPKELEVLKSHLKLGPFEKLEFGDDKNENSLTINFLDN
ncbi:putative membrane protein [Halobacteriovorax marinus SJ]|uniref:Membrane protein n=1 Tax=Halobacteriovorax marinus (strain ATCC BAA-682 / DSM 15412 / SJ) TaxID=862908 RepID=E1WZ39_HALMS|nr:pilus assembly protein PilM [Halobacteriovorax marinus]CBW26136.1 putative membrane protein [Halobacteriovorax marinus SJ]